MLPIQVTRSAAGQIQEAANWWFANRTKAPEAFEEELRRGFDLISHQPGVGAKPTNLKLQGVRRIYLSRVRYYLYYRVHSGRVEVLALWHASRGKSPFA